MLHWTEIDCLDRNGVIIGYTIKYGEGVARDIEINTLSISTTHFISGLKPFTEYSFVVAGVNGFGPGRDSAPTPLIKTLQDSKSIDFTLFF